MTGRLRAVLTTLAILLAAPLAPAGEPVDMELLLLVDVSGSVDGEEARLQRQGYASALTSGAVLEAVRSGGLGRIAVAYAEWADEQHHVMLADWTLLRDEAGLRAFAARILQAPAGTADWTALGSAIDYGTAQLLGNGFDGTRQVIDISGDGYSNRGTPPGEARDRAVAAGVTINGLPILNSKPNPLGGLPPVDLDAYYQAHVIGGPGAFIQVAEDFRAFGTAILAKLVKEIAALPDPAAGQMRHAAWTLDAPFPSPLKE